MRACLGSSVVLVAALAVGFGCDQLTGGGADGGVAGAGGGGGSAGGAVGAGGGAAGFGGGIGGAGGQGGGTGGMGGGTGGQGGGTGGTGGVGGTGGAGGIGGEGGGGSADCEAACGALADCAVTDEPEDLCPDLSGASDRDDMYAGCLMGCNEVTAAALLGLGDDCAAMVAAAAGASPDEFGALCGGEEVLPPEIPECDALGEALATCFEAVCDPAAAVHDGFVGMVVNDCAEHVLIGDLTPEDARATAMGTCEDAGLAAGVEAFGEQFADFCAGGGADPETCQDACAAALECFPNEVDEVGCVTSCVVVGEELAPVFDCIVAAEDCDAAAACIPNDD